MCEDDTGDVWPKRRKISINPLINPKPSAEPLVNDPPANLLGHLMRDFSDDLIADCDINETIVLESERSSEHIFRFFWWDAIEDTSLNSGDVLLFGKTYSEETQSYVSCCVVMWNIEKVLYFLPKTEIHGTKKPVTIMDVDEEVSQLMIQKGVKNFKTSPVLKKYVLDATVPKESQYLEVRYLTGNPWITCKTTGRTFSRVYGTDSSPLETFLIERKIKGPCWLEVTEAKKVTAQISTCKVEMDCVNFEKIARMIDEPPPPPLKISSIRLKCAMNPKTFKNEIVLISCVTDPNYSVDRQVSGTRINHFCIVTTPDLMELPPNFYAEMISVKTTTIIKANTEKGLLNNFIMELSKVDPDVVVGHDLIGYELRVLGEKLTHHKCAPTYKLGRLQESTFNWTKQEKRLFFGRLVADVKISAREFIKCRSYDLKALCQTVLKIPNFIDLKPFDIPKMYKTDRDLFKFIALTLNESLCILKILYRLNVIALAKELTNLSGNVMSRTLLGGKSERNEFLLLHAFANDESYLIPDKRHNDDFSSKTEGFSGGLVLTPKIGFYDDLVLVMDFNSMYPSIIQEFNICFTTIPPNSCQVPSEDVPEGILPKVVRELVKNRREILKFMQTEMRNSELYYKTDVRQTALKLTANSLYGCLGYQNSRFYAQNLAALIAQKGREILTKSCELVERLNYSVIYGDTDSFMIDTKLKDYDQVALIGHRLKVAINKQYKEIELGLDGIFKYLLLLNKKNYAAITVNNFCGEVSYETLYKGLDVVRRDYSQIASDVGKFVLSEILSDQDRETCRKKIRQHLGKVRGDLETNRVPPELFVIAKQLSKAPHLYLTSQAHVVVALRYNRIYGGHLGTGDTVPYVICEDGTKNPAAIRAYHITELDGNPSLKIDWKYYLEKQIYPVISRICAPITEHFDDLLITECLGLDRQPKSEIEKREFALLKSYPERFRDCNKFTFRCLGCQTENVLSAPLNNYNEMVLDKCTNRDCNIRPIDYLDAIKEQLIIDTNQYQEKFSNNYWKCTDFACDFVTNKVPQRLYRGNPICTQCEDAVMVKMYTEDEFYLQMAYFIYIFDLERAPKKVDLDDVVKKGCEQLKLIVKERLRCCSYFQMDIADIFSAFSIN